MKHYTYSDSYHVNGVTKKGIYIYFLGHGLNEDYTRYPVNSRLCNFILWTNNFHFSGSVLCTSLFDYATVYTFLLRRPILA